MNIICTHMHGSSTNQDSANTRTCSTYTETQCPSISAHIFTIQPHTHAVIVFRCLSLLSALQQAAVFMNLSHYFSTVCLTQEVKTQAVLTSANT